MSNIKRKVTLSGGQEMTLSFNALADLEQATGKSSLDVLASFDHGKMNITDTRALFWACLRQHNKQITLEEAGDLIEMDKLPELFGVSLPEANAEDESGNGQATGKK